MTRERAIEVLKAWDLNWSDSFTANEFEQAFTMAISALSENKGDLIRRCEAESVLHNNLHALIDTDQLYQLYKDIDRLPTYSFPNSAENKGEWIPVSERLPEKNVWVLVTVEQSGSRYQEIMRRNNYTEAWIGDDGGNYTDEITAWQPLPEPYKEGGKE